MMDKQTFDLCIIGGGINGCGIARDAAGRGYKVLLLERGDLAQGTSSASTKLIHGGLRYLEQYEFALVRKALKERAVLLNIAPHIVRPLEFILPHVPQLRPLWMLRLGVALYDFLAGDAKIKKSYKTNIKNKFLNKNHKNGISYFDCWADDARLVVLNAMDAMARGAVIKTRTAVKTVKTEADSWVIETDGGEVFHAQAVINAAGPWAEAIMDLSEGVGKSHLRLVRGSHIVIPKLFDEDNAYILQNDDGRIVFTIPYENDYTLVGTTEVDIGDDPDKNNDINDNEINYLKDIVYKYFNKKIRSVDVIHTFSGIRPLSDSEIEPASKASRDYKLDMQSVNGLPYLSILGGKLTTYRVLAEEATDKIDALFHKHPRHWTSDEKLPGGDIADNDIRRYIDEQSTVYPFLSRELMRRYVQSYGTCMNIILEGVKSLDDMGEDIGGGVYGREIDYLMAYEFAQTAEDVLWRRSKLGLHLDKAGQKAVADYMENSYARR